MQQAVEEFIKALHLDLELWLLGRGDEHTFERIGQAHADEFRLSGTDGAVRNRLDVMELIRAAHGAESDSFRIAIENCEVIASEAGLVVASYVERQRLDDKTFNARRSTACLRVARDGGLKMLYLSETSLPADAIPTQST